MAVATARELRNRVSNKFGKRSEAVSYPEHVVLYEVPVNQDGTRRRIDAVAIGVWRKTGNLVHGFELKVSRADLLHELRDLTKSEPAVRAVDRFWLVLGDKALMRDTDPIPESWGIIVAHGRGLRIVREAAPQAGELDRSLLVGMVTRALVAPRMGTAIRYRDGLIRGYRDAEDTYKMRLAYAENRAAEANLLLLERQGKS